MSATAPTVKAALANASASVDRREARLLLAHALGCRTEWLLAHDDDALDAATHERFLTLVQRRARGEPVAYLLGTREFHSRAFLVDPAVLIPRPETEGLVEFALARLPPDFPGRVLDLGTGSGNIAISVAAERPRVRVHAVDASQAALAVAAANARLHGVQARIDFVLGDWRDAGFVDLLHGTRFDLLLSNPPYIALGDPHLRRGDLRFEPPGALAAGPSGTESIQHICGLARQLLAPGGFIALEHGFDQGAACRQALEAGGLTPASTRQDLDGLDRISHAGPIA